jgi:uncharacterized tellurite resistance protein B-like protein
MPALAQMKLLINLARVDGKVAVRERNYIVNIGRANGLYPDEIEPLFDQKHEPIVPEGLTADQKFEYIYSLVQLMKIDERMYKEEMQFCSDIANKLGYRKEVLIELMLEVKANEMQEYEMNTLKRLINKYLIK